MLSRIGDVTVGTMRIIAVPKGRKLLASVLGFFEVLIWVIAITQVMRNLNNVVTYLAYAGGFALGNYIGITIEERLAIGEVVCGSSSGRMGLTWRAFYKRPAMA